MGNTAYNKKDIIEDLIIVVWTNRRDTSATRHDKDIIFLLSIFSDKSMQHSLLLPQVYTIQAKNATLKNAHMIDMFQ